MIRKLILPAVAIAFLGGCISPGYGYRQDRGDYYYGQPGVDYRYYSPYGYPSSGYGYGYGYPSSRYGYPRYPYYRSGGGYYGNPYQPYPGYPYYPYSHHHRPHHPRPPVGVTPPPDDGSTLLPPSSDGGRPPWRDLNNLGRRDVGQPPRIEPAPVTQTLPTSQPRPQTRPAGSRNEQIMRRARSESSEREIE